MSPEIIPVQLVDNRDVDTRGLMALWTIVDRYVLDPWTAMLIIGAAHHRWPVVPTTSFGHTVLLVMLVRTVLNGDKMVPTLTQFTWKGKS